MRTNNKSNFSFSLNNLNGAQKKSLLKLLGILVLIIVIFTVFSRSTIFTGETLSEYAQKNPDLAYGESVAETKTLDEELENVSGTTE